MRVLPLLALAACQPSYSDIELNELDDASRGLLGDGLLYPFPNAQLVRNDRVYLPADEFPGTETPLPTQTIAFRSGYSPVQTGVLTLADVDAAALPTWREHTPGEGGVRLIDLTMGEYLPVMAELDAYCEAEDPDFEDKCATWPDEDPALLIRPQAAVPYGHRVAVVVTDEAAPRPPRFERLVGRSRSQAPDDFAHRADHYRDLLDDIEDAVGLSPDSVAVAWDYPVGDGTTPLRSALDQLEVPNEWRFDVLREADNGDAVATSAWKAQDGFYTVPDYLIDDNTMDVAADGTVTATGTTEAYMWIHIPLSVRDAPLRSVPVVIVGHGIFGSIGDFLDLDGFDNSFTEVAEEQGWIMIGTNQRGLDWSDREGAINVARDFGTIDSIPHRMAQGQVNQRVLIEMIKQEDFLDADIFQGESGQPLVDPEHVYYWGASMGSILGGVAVGSGAPVDRAALHIGGSSWSTLLERSAAWTIFEVSMVDTVPHPTDRQLLYSASQLWWDVADPIAYVDDLRDKEFLLQENKGDESVSNVGTRMFARSLDLPVLAPAVDLPPGMTEASGTITGSAFVQFDPAYGEPTDWNRPADISGPHGAAFGWAGTNAQIVHFLTTGEVKSYCGDNPCSRFNPGSGAE